MTFNSFASIAEHCVLYHQSQQQFAARQIALFLPDRRCVLLISLKYCFKHSFQEIWKSTSLTFCCDGKLPRNNHYHVSLWKTKLVWIAYWNKTMLCPWISRHTAYPFPNTVLSCTLVTQLKCTVKKKSPIHFWTMKQNGCMSYSCF